MGRAEGLAQFPPLGVTRVGKQQAASLMKCLLPTAAAAALLYPSGRLAAVITQQIHSQGIQERKEEVKATWLQSNRGRGGGGGDEKGGRKRERGLEVGE